MATATTTEQQRDEYLRRVGDLYETIIEWLKALDPRATISTENVTITEEAVSPYEAKSLLIQRPGRKPVRLIPRGRWIIGAEGRVDLKSDLGSETLVYVAEGGPQITIQEISESGRILEPGKLKPIAQDVAEGWVYVQNRRLGIFPSLDADLFYRLLEVLSR